MSSITASVIKTETSKPINSVLVTGATGRHGGTGPLIVRLLRERDISVRAMVRRRDERCNELEKLGAKVVVADFTDYRSLLVALEGVEHAYFCYPVAEGIVEATALFAAAGREQGLAHIVNNSMGASHPHSPSRLARAQWLSEQMLDWAGFQCAHVRGGFFFENILLISEETIVREGIIENGFGAVSITWVAAEDLARVCAVALLEPSLRGIIWVTGQEVLNFGKIAAAFTDGLGRQVRFVDLSSDYEQWKRVMVENPRINPAMRDHLAGLAEKIKLNPGIPVTDTVERLTGKKPITLTEFIATHRTRLLDRFEGELCKTPNAA
jgi:NAD(P)H dehydrogenase (quinone)